MTKKNTYSRRYNVQIIHPNPNADYWIKVSANNKTQARAIAVDHLFQSGNKMGSTSEIKAAA